MSSLTTQLRQNLKSYCDIKEKGGTLDCHHLTLGNQTYTREFIEGCLQELDRIDLRVKLGDRISNLEKLAYDLLAYDLLKVGAFVEHNNI